MKIRISLIALGWLHCVPLALAADPSTVARNWPAEVASRVTRLASGSAEERVAATDWIMNSEPEALPAIEAAAKQAGTDSAAGRALSALLTKLQPLAKIRSDTEAIRQNELVWNERTALEAYEKFGSKNPKWNEEARKALRQFVSRTLSERAAARATLEHVTTDLHCDDPMVWYFKARMLQREPKPDLLAVLNAYLDACEAFQKSDYPAFRKCNAYTRFVQFLSGVDTERKNPARKEFGEKLAKEALALWPAAVAEPGATRKLTVDLAKLTLAAQTHYGADRAKVLDEMLPPFEKAFPPGNIALVFAGDAFIEYAWDARGTGFANTVTPEGWKLMSERLVFAEGLLTEAYKRDPSDAAAATAMISCELGQAHGREVMEKWFRRAVSANPIHFRDVGSLDAYAAKLYYLQPKWFGSVEDCLAFGRECAATHDYRDGVTSVLIDAHEGFAKESADPQAYWYDPQVWSDVQSVFLPPIQASPEDHSYRTRYAYWACRCGQWKIADEQFKMLGENIEPLVWPTKAASDAARAEAAQRAR